MTRIAGTYKELFEEPHFVDVRRHCEYITDLSRAMDEARDAAIRGTDGLDDTKVAARRQFIDISNQAIHARMMEELGHLYDGLKGLVIVDD